MARIRERPCSSPSVSASCSEGEPVVQRHVCRWCVIAATALLVAPFGWAQDVRVSAHGMLAAPSTEAISALAFSASGALLLVGNTEGVIACWDVQRKTIVSSFTAEEEILFVAFLPGDREFVVVDKGGTIAVFAMLQRSPHLTFSAGARPLRVAIDAGRQFLATATSDDNVKIYDLKAQVPVGTIDGAGRIDNIFFLGFDRLGQQLVAVTEYADVVTWNPATLKLLRTMTLSGGELQGSQAIVHSVATNRATNVFAVALEEVALPKGGIQSGRDLERRSMIIAYDWQTGAEVKRVTTSSAVERMALGPGNDHVAAAGDENRNITFYDLRKGEAGSSVSFAQEPTMLAVSEDNQWLAAGGDEGVVGVWKLQYREQAPVTSRAAPSLSGRIRARTDAPPALPPDTPVKLAILGFDAKGVPAEVADVCVSSMTNALANFDYITLVERRQIETVLKEQQFQLSGLTEDEGVSVGRILKADIILVGNVGKLGTSVVFSARLINVETGKVMKGREVICEECRDEDMYDAINALVGTIAR